MQVDRKILIAVAGFVIVAAAGGFALIKEIYPRSTPPQQAAAADVAKDVQNAAHQATPADVAKDVQAMKHETSLPKALDNYTELVDIRADGQAVVFVHRLTFEAKQSKAYQFLAAVRTNLLRPVCSQQKMAKAINEGVVFRYQYADVVGFDLGSFDIGGSDCAG